MLKVTTALLTVLSLAGAAGLASAQTVDEIVARYTEAKGGLDRLRSVDAVRQTGTVRILGVDGTAVVYIKRPNLLRQEVQLGGQTLVSAFDGLTPWVQDPLSGPAAAVEATGDQAAAIRAQADFDGPLVDWRAKGYALALVGVERVGPRAVHHLRLVGPDQAVQHWYLDAATGLETRLVREVDGGTVEYELSDHRPVGGIVVPFAVRVLRNGVLQSELTVRDVEVDVAIDDALFARPR